MGFYLAGEIGRILVAAVCLLGLLLLRKRKTSDSGNVLPMVPEPALDIPEVTPSIPTMPMHLVDPLLKLRTQSGSWYLYSLMDAPYDELCKTFDKISFSEAVTVLNRFEEKDRKDLVERMRLAPAFQKRLSELIENGAIL